MKTKIAIFLLAAVALCGCHSDHYYHNEAVNRARRYLLENTADLDSEQINYVRFNTPVLLHSKVLGGGVMRPGYVPMEMHQVCVTWIIPGKDDLYMVFGVSTGRMSDWSPNRVIKRSFRKSKAVLPDAAAPCVAYAQNNFFNRLEPNEISIVRFTAPYLYATDFDLNLNPTGKLSDKELAEARTKASAKKQYSLVWKLNRRNLVFSGLADAGFVGWKSEMAGVLSDAELAPHLGKELMTPADYFKPFPAEKEPPAVKVAPAAKPAAKAPESKPAPAAKPEPKAAEGEKKDQRTCF